MYKKQQKFKAYNRITSYTEFVDYCLRRLGAPVVDINVEAEQLRDRVSDAIQYYVENDSESVVETYWTHRVTEEDVINGCLVMPLEVIGVIDVMCPSNEMSKVLYNGPLTPKKCKRGRKKKDTEITSNKMSENKNPFIDNMYNGFIPNGLRPQTVLGPDGNLYDWNLSNVDFGDDEFMTSYLYNWWNEYWNAGYAMYHGDANLFYFETAMEHLSLIKQLFCARTEFSYRNRERKIWLMSHPLRVGDIYCIYGVKQLDPETDDCIYDSDWLKQYATALIGIQWGVNISKFGSIPSAGGLTINADNILQRYMEEKIRLEEEHRKRYQEPPKPMVG